MYLVKISGEVNEINPKLIVWTYDLKVSKNPDFSREKMLVLMGKHEEMCKANINPNQP